MITKCCAADAAAIAEAAAWIRAGEVVAFPTETVYGLGANALDAQAVEKIFRAKGRPGDNPLIVHVVDLERARSLIAGDMPLAARTLARAYWPGPLTMIFPKGDCIPRSVTAGLDTIGIRLPAHPVARALIEAADLPIAAPSANRSGRPSPTLAAHVLEDMDGRIPMILDSGACEVGLESTVLDMTCDPPRVLRPGGVTAEMIREVLGAVDVDASALRPLEQGEKPRSPGMKYRHYAPKGTLYIVRGARERVAKAICDLYDRQVAQGKRVAILAPGAHRAHYADRRYRALGEGEELSAMAAELFSALREMDEEHIDVMYAEAVAAEGLGLAVMNRLGRAAAFQIIDVDGV